MKEGKENGEIIGEEDGQFWPGGEALAAVPVSTLLSGRSGTRRKGGCLVSFPMEEKSAGNQSALGSTSSPSMFNYRKG